MAKLKMNGIFSDLHGKVGDLVFRRGPNGQTIVYQAPDISQVEYSEAQLAQQGRIGEAHAYSRAAMIDPEMRAFYEQEARKKNKTPYKVAFQNYFQVQKRIGE